MVSCMQDGFDDASQDFSKQISDSEKSAEQEKNSISMQLDRDMASLESRKRPRRKIPRPGCYPYGFSEYTMHGVPCTLALKEIRGDISKCSVTTESTTVYFDEMGTGERSSRAETSTRQQLPAGRWSKRKPSQEAHLRPRSAAEERRQLEAVLLQSMQEYGMKRRAFDDTQAAGNQPSPTPCQSTLQICNVHQRNMFAAQILCRLH